MELAVLERLQLAAPDNSPSRVKPFEDLSALEIDDSMRACEQWYARNQDGFSAFKSQYLAISFNSWVGPDQVEMRNVTISPSELEVVREFERRFGKFGGYVRRIGDPIIDF
jgi:hypothetical protein